MLGQKQLYPPSAYISYVSTNIGDNNRGGSAILVRNSVASTLLNINSPLQVVAARIHTNKSYTICSLYLPPTQVITEQDISNLIRQLPKPFILMGDFNARDPFWGDSLTNANGKVILKIIESFNLCCLNDGSPTHYHSQTDSFTNIDLTICSGDILHDFNFSVLEFLFGSDHFPTMISTNIPSASNYLGRWNFNKAQWDIFYTFTSNINNYESFESVQSAIDYFNKFLLDASKSSIPKPPHTGGKPKIPWWNNDCQDALAAKKKAFRRFKRSRLQIDWMAYKKLRAKAKKTLRAARKESWQRYVSSINSKTPISVVWKRIKKMKNKYSSPRLPILKINGNLISDPFQTSEELAKSFAKFSSESNYSDKFRRLKRIKEKNPVVFTPSIIEEYNFPFSMDEFNQALNNTKNTAAGPDEISIQLIKQLAPEAKCFLLKLFNDIWTNGSFPTQWRDAIIIPIPKPDKDPQNPINYRPISLTSSICKLMERMVSSRLTWILENREIFAEEQFGFRKHHSTIDALTHLEHDIQQAFSRKEMVGAVFFDLEKAYDSTWRWNVLNQLKNIGLRGSLPLFIKNLLSNRTFKVRVGTSLSGTHSQMEGVPQGSVLSVLCFALAVNEVIPAIPNNIAKILYVDDLTIYCHGSYMPAIARRLQNAINKVMNWADQIGFKFSTKTKCMNFSRRRKRMEALDLFLSSTKIEEVHEKKFLGLVFDKKLSWKAHVSYLRNSCRQPLDLMTSLSHQTWGADRGMLQRLYTSLIRSKLDYCCHLYNSASKHNLDRLEPIQNRALRISSGAFRSSPALSLQVENNIPPLSCRRMQYSFLYYLRSHQFADSGSHKLISAVTPTFPNWHLRCLLDDSLAELNLQNINYSKCSHPPIPPWVSSPANVCLAHYSKKQKSDRELRAEFFSHASLHWGSAFIFTDGSRSDAGVTSAAFFEFNDVTYKHRLSPLANIFTAELFAIILSLRHLLDSTETNITIFSDSQSALQSLNKPSPTHPLLFIIHKLLNRMKEGKKQVNFCWVPGHVGIPGNEKADTAAKSANRPEIPLFEKVPPLDLKRTFIQHSISKWQSNWSAQLHNKLFNIKPRVREWPSSYQNLRRNEVVLSRLRIGHTRLTHRYLMEQQPPPICPSCQTRITVPHFLIECPTYQRQRNNCFPTLRLIPPAERMSFLLGDSDRLRISAVFKFLSEINIYREI